MHKTSAWIGDAWGGLAAMLVALPSAIAYGVAALAPLGASSLPLGAMAGVMGVIALGLSTPGLGGAARLITAPCAPAAAVLSALAAERIASGSQSPAEILVFLAMVALLSSFLQMLYGALGGGRIIKFIPYPVVAGYLSAVGLLIFLSQVPKWLGLPRNVTLAQGLTHPDLWQSTGILTGLVTIIGMIAAPWITRRLPAPVFGLLLGMGSYFLSSLNHPELLRLTDNPLLVGPIQVDFSTLRQGFEGRWQALGQLHLRDLFALLVPAFTLSALLSVDTLKTCVVVDAMTRSRHDSNRELMAQGVGNLISTLLGGMPGAGTMGATLVSINSGGHSRLAGILEGFFSLLVLLFFSSLLGWVPIPALAGILIVVAWRMVDWHSFSLLRRSETFLDFFVVATVVVVAIVFNLIAAAGAGMALAVVLFVRDQVKTSVIRRKLYGGQYSSKHQRLPEERKILEDNRHLVVICELQGNLFFGTTDQLFSRLETDLSSCRFLIFDMSRVQTIDFTAMHMLGQMDAMLSEGGAHLILTEPSRIMSGGQNPIVHLEHLVLRPTEHLQTFATLDEAIEWVEDQILAGDVAGRVAEEWPLPIHEFPLFLGLEEEGKEGVLALLGKVVEERSYKAGETLFQRGDPGDEMYFIRKGGVRIVLPIHHGKEHTLAIFGRGGFLGDMAFIDLAPRSSNAVTIMDTEVFILSRHQFDLVSGEDPEMAKNVFIRLCKVLTLRLRFADAEIMALKEA
ncbi:MAG: SLC26A/SulP transporter family protein [Magnetococcales bacterium]|nr:SLC26A/SulP transporter family protein [Magnetococcales bacterium]MBF0149179.1 SLC26A/SulP transporter family protein [Magnetococcales bacterium]